MGVAASLTVLLFGDFVPGPLGSAITKIETFVDVFITLYSVVLIAYIVTSWVRLPYSVALNRIQRFLYDVAEPYLRLFRRLLPFSGPLDFSPIIAFLMLGVIDAIVHLILNQFH